MKKFSIKTLATSLSLAMTAPLAMTAQASDIEIYQEATAGSTSLVFMLDISGSMDVRSVSEDYKGNSGQGLLWINEGSNIYRNQFRYLTERGYSGYTREYRRVTQANANSSQSVKDECVPDGSYYKCYSRMARLQDAFYLLLNGGTDLKGNTITKLSDDKVIGLSSLGVYINGRYQNTGRMVVPSRRLDAMVGGKTQRQVLTEAMSQFTASTNTPTARSFAETVAYFMGRNTTTPPAGYRTSATQYLYVPRLDARYSCYSAFPAFCTEVRANTTAYLSNSQRIGTGQESNINKLSWSSFDITTNAGSGKYAGYTYTRGADKVIGQSGFQYSDSSTKNGSNYVSPLDGDSCSSQGIYVLTDGEPSLDEGSEGLFASAFGENFTCPNTGDSFFCAIEASKKLLSGNHARKVPIKTAVVGFGEVFTRIPSYNPALTEEENLKNVGVINGDIVNSLADGDKVANIEQKRAAAWGIVGGGGWYSGSSTVSVVDSVNQFLNKLTTDIPAMTTGSPTIPVSALNRQTLLADAYYASFAPKPDKAQQLWTGNMNKYATVGGVLHGQSDQPLFQSNGLVNVNTLGLWDTASGSGVLGNLRLQEANGNTQRQVYTEGAGDTRALTQVTVASLRNGALSSSPAKNHWLNLLGYNISENETVDFNQLSSKPELRQLGATMHSSPLLLTQSGKIDRQLQETNRDDYILYGSTQGVLHIVDATTGEERFAFVPQKMVEKQKQAFLHEGATSGGKDNLFYGIDGAWVSHTEYVVRESDGALTVGPATTGSNLADVPRGKQWVYGGLRMGGRNYYSLDLSTLGNPTKQGITGTPQNAQAPTLKFNIDPDDQAVYSPAGKKSYPELAHMGQSWSKPALGYVNWPSDDPAKKGEFERRLVMFVGGGYDEGYETSDYVQNNGKGAGVYMFDANTGDLLWWASNNSVTGGKALKHTTILQDDRSDLQYSVVSRINAFDRDSDGLVDTLYFGDLAGQGFRIDLDNNKDRVDFSVRVVKIFDEHQTNGTSPRFYEMPSISIHKRDDNDTLFAVVAFGSGDRSSPLAGVRNDRLNNPVTVNVNTADDATIVVYDYDLGKANWRALQENQLDTHYKKGALRTAELNSDFKNTDREVKADGINQGWKYTYPIIKKGGVKSFGEPYAIANLLFVNTYDRDGGGLSGQCGAGVIGVSRTYQFCLPTGICEKDKHGYVRSEPTPVASNATPGLVEMTLGLNSDGKVGNLGNISASKDSTVGTNQAVDCKLSANQSRPECLNVETPSVLSQLRWFESRKEGK